MLRWNSENLALLTRIVCQPDDVTTRAPRIEFYPAADGRRLAVRIWDVAASPQARAVFLHGITSHGGWYGRSSESLTDAGFEVHFLDRRGSGLNADKPGDVDSWTTWIDDVAAYLDRIRGEPPRGYPAVLCGISWGGKLATAVARRHPGLVPALGLICPGLYSPHEPGLMKRLTLSAPAPERVQQRRLEIPLQHPALFTDCREWREFVARDPLSLRTVTWRFAREDRQLTRYARQAGPFLHMPMLLMLAGRDRIVDNRRTRAFFARTAASRRTLVEYPGAAHTLEFEPDPLPYFADLTNWIGAVAKN
jgi:alpha-beta hydrolase superfamily lysophospholipase